MAILISVTILVAHLGPSLHEYCRIASTGKDPVGRWPRSYLVPVLRGKRHPAREELSAFSLLLLAAHQWQLIKQISSSASGPAAAALAGWRRQPAQEESKMGRRGY